LATGRSPLRTTVLGRTGVRPLLVAGVVKALLAGLVLLLASGALADYVPETGCYLGAYIRLDEVVKDDIGAFEKLTGKKHATYFRYVGYGAPFPFRWVESLHRRGALPHLAWEPNNGLEPVRDNDYLHGWAEAAARTGGPIFLRYASEMNGTWQAYSGDPAKYIEKWRLVCRVMREVAPNVIMVWCPFATPQATITEYYPGDEWVDWVGVNIYSVHHYDGEPDKPANDDPRDLLRYVYDLYAKRKPIAICEYAATHYCAACKQDVTEFGLQQMTRLYRALPTEFPRVKMINWFSVDAAGSGIAHNDYSITNSDAMLARYQELTADPHFLSEVAGAPTHPTAWASVPPSTEPRPDGQAVGLEPAPAVDEEPPVTEYPLALAQLGPVTATGLDVAISGAPPHRVNGPVEIVAEPGTRLKVGAVMFYIDGSFQAVTNVMPYRCPWNAANCPPGPHQVRVVALDRDNNPLTEKTVSVVVVSE